ncbi:pilus assembly protein CpaE [Motilibacter aurantiacus]|uniref:pilus assembly protein CpaE n=1 Tax=Motilibacter aurantiacus TaxID=2714955 RepID=UPI00140D1B36|nr:pilus assembly protein CpaE [Motilibacter aurantiacus]NHC44993.1 pilus assembly protein CpaE [Motilibacter aurantiacus]
MLSLGLARRLRDAGLTWEPASGDRFVLLGPEMTDDVFVLSDMVADVHHFPSGPVIGFNGTVEWALDSVSADDALWLPTEEQLRERLGDAFDRLERTGDGFRVVCGAAAFEALWADDAYALALLERLGA